MTFDRNGPVLPLGRYCITTLATAAGMWKALIVRPTLVGLISCRPALPAAGECSTSKVPPRAAHAEYARAERGRGERADPRDVDAGEAGRVAADQQAVRLNVARRGIDNEHFLAVHHLPYLHRVDRRDAGVGTLCVGPADRRAGRRARGEDVVDGGMDARTDEVGAAELVREVIDPDVDVAGAEIVHRAPRQAHGVRAVPHQVIAAFAAGDGVEV